MWALRIANSLPPPELVIILASVSQWVVVPKVVMHGGPGYIAKNWTMIVPSPGRV